MSENTNLTYYQRNRDMVLSKAKDYYKNNNERLKKHAKDKYRNLSEEDKNKKREYGKNRYHNMSEEKKQRLKEYQKRKYQEAKTNYSLSDSLSDEVNSKSSLIRFSTFLFLTSYLHSSKSI